MDKLVRSIFLFTVFVSVKGQVSSDLGRVGGGRVVQFERGFSDSSPFAGASRGIRVEARTFDIGKVNRFNQSEFDSLWLQFRSSHAIDPRGVFTEHSGSLTEDNKYTQVEFIRYVSRHNPVLSREVNLTCNKCDRHGMVPRSSGVGLEVADVKCGDCGGQKKYNQRIDYTLVSSLPLPERLEFGDAQRTRSVFPLAESHQHEGLAQRVATLRGVAPKSDSAGVAEIRFHSTGSGIELEVAPSQGKEDAPKDFVCSLKFHSNPDGRGQLVAEAKAAFEGSQIKAGISSIRSFSQLSFPGLDAESHKHFLSYYGEVLSRLSTIKSARVEVTSVSPSGAKSATASSLLIDVRPSIPELPVAKSPVKQHKVAYGSGMVFTDEGHVFTNEHVIDGADEVFIVVYSNGQLIRKLPAAVVSKDSKLDLAILKVEGWGPEQGSPRVPPRIASSEECRLGDQVFVLGYPLPDTLSSNVKFTRGDISDKAGIGDDSSKIQHTASIQPGNSGGPMALMDGRVVGIVVSSLSASFTLRKSGALPQGVNFSIKSDYLLTMAKVAGIKLPQISESAKPEADSKVNSSVEWVKAYTVQIMAESK